MDNNLRLPEPLHSLMNGLERGAVTNFYGAPGTGKTNICLLAALECARRGGSVAFIDTEGGFSLERFRQLTPDAEGILGRIAISEPQDFREQGRVIKELEGKSPGLVVLDSAVALYRLECAGQERAPDGLHQSGKDLRQLASAETDTRRLVPVSISRQTEGCHTERAARPEGKSAADSRVLMPMANKELSRQLSMLSRLSRARGVPVLITAHTYRNWETGSNEVIGGDSLKYWSNALIFIDKTGKTGERIAVLHKHRSLSEGRSVKFLITQDGIRPSGFKLF